MRRGAALRAQADCFAPIAAILGRQYELLLEAVEVTLRPTIVGAAVQLQDFLGRELQTVLRLVELGPVLGKLVTAVLSHEQPAGRFDRKSLAIADAGGRIPSGWRSGRAGKGA
jgi:hypothetical protein